MNQFIESLRRLYQDGKITETTINRLFDDGKITLEDKLYIFACE